MNGQYRFMNTNGYEHGRDSIEVHVIDDVKLIIVFHELNVQLCETKDLAVLRHEHSAEGHGSRLQCLSAAPKDVLRNYVSRLRRKANDKRAIPPVFAVQKMEIDRLTLKRDRCCRKSECPVKRIVCIVY